MVFRVQQAAVALSLFLPGTTVPFWGLLNPEIWAQSFIWVGILTMWLINCLSHLFPVFCKRTRKEPNLNSIPWSLRILLAMFHWLPFSCNYEIAHRTQSNCWSSKGENFSGGRCFVVVLIELVICVKCWFSSVLI